MASLFLWHFVEEVEHRSSALVIYDAVVGNRWYRIRVIPRVVKHMLGALVFTICLAVFAVIAIPVLVRQWRPRFGDLTLQNETEMSRSL